MASLEVTNRSQCTVKTERDKTDCVITGICELPGGEILITDFSNKKVKLLNLQYQVIATCDLRNEPTHICHIAENKAAITLGDTGVYLITVEDSTPSVTKRFPSITHCLGISHHNGNLYVGSCKAIYQYTMTGRLKKAIYVDNSAGAAVNRFTVSRDGTSIYIADPSRSKLITIDTNGKILSTLEDQDFHWPISVCVSDGGHVFVCSHMSKKVTQVDKEGNLKLATLVTETDVRIFPVAVWLSGQTNSLIVGGIGNEISVFDLTDANKKA